MPAIPKPSKTKRAEGNRSKLAKRKTSRDPVGIGLPRPPPYLNEVELGMWKDTVQSLPVGLVTRADEAMLERFVKAWSKYRRLDQQIENMGDMLKSPHGWIRNPLCAQQAECDRVMHKCAQELGLSPAARARLSTPEAAIESPLAILLGPDADPNGAWLTQTSKHIDLETLENG